MHFVIHTQYYPPEVGAPQSRLSELAQGLVHRGNQVSVLTGMPNYPQGKIYPGYGGLLQRDQVQGIQVIRTALYPTNKLSVISRLVSYFSFVFSSWLIGGPLLNEPDFILTESPPLFLGISGYLLSRWKRARWIFNVSDLWPESAVRLGVLNAGWSLQLSYALEGFCYRKAWAVTGQSRSILESISKRFPDVHTYHFSNGVDINQFSPCKSTPQAENLLNSNGRVTAIYAGLHGLAQGLDQVLYASHLLRDLSELQIVFVGDGPEKRKLEALARELSLHNVLFLDPVPKTNVAALLTASDICLVPLKTNIPGAVPSKLYEAMASERPVILVAEGEATEIVNNNHAGIVVKPGDIKGLAGAIHHLVDHPEVRNEFGHAGREAAVMYFNREDIIEDFVNFLNG